MYPGALIRVTNGVFFIAIRTVWANYQFLSSTQSSGPVSTGVVSIRDPVVAKLEGWEPQAYLTATYSMPMAFEYSMVTDLRDRARQSGHLKRWQEEGNIVERWAKQSLSAGASDPARGDLGKFLSDFWAEGLSRQLVAQRVGLHEANGNPSRLCARTHCRHAARRAQPASPSMGWAPGTPSFCDLFSSLRGSRLRSKSPHRGGYSGYLVRRSSLP